MLVESEVVRKPGAVTGGSKRLVETPYRSAVRFPTVPQSGGATIDAAPATAPSPVSGVSTVPGGSPLLASVVRFQLESVQSAPGSSSRFPAGAARAQGGAT